MIVNPTNWRMVGVPITISAIEQTIIEVLQELQVTNIALSGGIDSSLILYYLTLIHPISSIRTFTIALNENHPDYVHAKEVSEYFGVSWTIHIPNKTLIRSDSDFPGDEIVREFFDFLQLNYVRSIICCDGIDEFMCGYYDHCNDATENTYYDYIRRLQEEHLIPLDKNSGNVNVVLPYIDKRLLALYTQIPLREKCDEKTRKKIMLKLADGKLPKNVLERRKYGFCDAMRIRDSQVS